MIFTIRMVVYCLLSLLVLGTMIFEKSLRQHGP